MKIYTQDLSWAGCILVIANSEEEAREMMEGEYNYSSCKPVECHEIEHGFIYSNLGDI